MYRILHASHHRTGDDVVHLPDVRLGARPVATRIEGITHSICTLEFEDHRPLYDWFLDAARHLPPAADRVRAPEPDLHGDEQAQAAASWCEEGIVARLGRPAHADDLRACAAAATRRRRSATSAERIGVAKHDSVVDVALLEHCVREDLNQRAAARAWRCCDPLKVVIDELPGRAGRGARGGQQPRGSRAPARARCPSRASSTSSATTSCEDPPKKFFRLAPGPRGAAALRATSSRATRWSRTQDGRGRRAALHLRSGHPRRRHARRPQGQGDDPLGVGGARGRRRGAALRPPVHRGEPRRRAGRGRLARRS